jgi:hypothetical protein
MNIISWLFGTRAMDECLQETHKELYNKSVKQQLSLYDNYTVPNRLQHYSLRLLKSHPALSDSAFCPVDPFEAIALLVDDLSTYTSLRSECSKERLFACKTLLIQAIVANQLATLYKNPIFYDFYYAIVAEKIKTLATGDHFLLLGGSPDHALLFSVKSLSTTSVECKLFNSGDSVSKYHHKFDDDHYQTYLITLETSEAVKKNVLRRLFDSAFFNHSITSSYQKLQLVADSQLSSDWRLAHKKQLHDNTCLRTIFCSWLKEEALVEEYPAFKRAFSQKAFEQWPTHPYRNLAKDVLLAR